MKKILIITGSVVGLLGALFLVYWLLIPGTITVKTNMPKSKIYIDNVMAGNGSSTQKAKRGTHEIKVENDGYAGAITNVDILGLQTRDIKVDLKKLPEPAVMEKGVTTLDRDNDGKNLIIGQLGGKQFGLMMPTANQTQQISRVDFGEAVRAKWAPSKFLVFVWRKDGTNGLVDLKRYDLLSQEFHLWPNGVGDLAWAHNTNEVIYVYKPGDGEFSLVKSNPINQNVERLLLHLDRQGLTNPLLEMTKDDGNLLITDKDLYVYNFYSHELKRLTRSGNIKSAKLSFNGKYILYSTNEGTYLSKLDGTKIKKLGMKFDNFNWLPNGEEVIGFDNGQWEKINAVTGVVTKYGYNGPKIANVSTVNVLGDGETVYYLAKNVLYSLRLQSKVEKY